MAAILKDHPRPRLSHVRHSLAGPAQFSRVGPVVRRRVVALAAILAMAVVGAVPLPASVAASAAGVPTVTPRVDCVVSDTRTDTYWFGYETDATARAQLLISGWGAIASASTNAVVEFDGDVAIDRTPNRGQVEFFTAGLHERVFAITVSRHHRLTWTLATPADAAVTGVAAPVSVSTDGAAPCPRHTGRRSASLQTDGTHPSILPRVGRGVVVDGLLTRSSITFEVGGVQSACSGGGKPLPPLVLWGYDDSVTQASVGLPTEVPRDGFDPLPARSVVRTDTFTSESHYARTFVSTRRVADPQRSWVDPLTLVSSRGIAATMVLADVHGRCAFGRRIVTSVEPMWVTADGLPTLVVAVTDEATQATMPVTCTLEVDCPIRVLVGPGGVRWR